MGSPLPLCDWDQGPPTEIPTLFDIADDDKNNACGIGVRASPPTSTIHRATVTGSLTVSTSLNDTIIKIYLVSGAVRVSEAIGPANDEEGDGFTPHAFDNSDGTDGNMANGDGDSDITENIKAQASPSMGPNHRATVTGSLAVSTSFKDTILKIYLVSGAVVFCEGPNHRATATGSLTVSTNLKDTIIKIYLVSGAVRVSEAIGPANSEEGGDCTSQAFGNDDDTVSTLTYGDGNSDNADGVKARSSPHIGPPHRAAVTDLLGISACPKDAIIKIYSVSGAVRDSEALGPANGKEGDGFAPQTCGNGSGGDDGGAFG